MQKGKHTRPSVRPARTVASRLLKAFYILLMVLSALIVVTYCLWTYAIQPPTIEEPPAETAPAETGPAETAPGETAPIETGPVRERREQVYTCLIFGMDDGNGNTDTIMVATFDVPNQKIGLMSIPRDTVVRQDRSAAWNKINAAYADGGVEQLDQELEELLGFPIDYYVKIKLSAFEKLVESVGGVWFDVPVDMDYDDPYQDLHIHYTKGQHHLNGQQAMEVVRFRHNNDGSGYTDVGRAEMQRQVLVALAKKVVSWNSLTKVQEFVEIFQEYVKTDLSTTDMLYFASQAVGVDLDTGITQGTLEGRGEGVVRGYKYCFVFQAEDILPTLNELVNPYDQPLTEEDLDLPQAEYYWNGTVID